jgi:hypothetical protein
MIKERERRREGKNSAAHLSQGKGTYHPHLVLTNLKNVSTFMQILVIDKTG